MVRAATVVRPTWDDPSVAVKAGVPSSQLKHIARLRFADRSASRLGVVCLTRFAKDLLTLDL
jgi:hypothetical protein